MSYILEALKKAQAERQLGSAPTIHAMPIEPAQASDARANRIPLYAVSGLLVLAIIGGGVAWWTRVPASNVAVVSAPATPATVVAPATVPVAPAPPPVAVATPAPQPAPAAAPAPRVQPEPLAPSPVKAKPEPVVEPARVAQAPVTVPAPVPAPAPVEAPEEHYPLLRELPEAVQRDVPRVAIGGYIYSKNPADRLLLVDKVLRREGEEVGAGLVLERLQSKAAVMNYRGTRFRVPY